jgi:DNA-binding MarR family transcriptional regulator
MMQATERTKIINDFLASTHIFYSAVNELMEEHLREDLGNELTVPQYRLLKLVGATKIGNISDVAIFGRVTNAAASKAVDRLVRRGLMARTESAKDRRVSNLSLTPEGRELLERYEAVQSQVLEGLFRQFMPEEFTHMVQLLDRLSADIVGMESGPQQLCFRCGIFFRDKCLVRDVVKRECSYHLHEPNSSEMTEDSDNKD